MVQTQTSQNVSLCFNEGTVFCGLVLWVNTVGRFTLGLVWHVDVIDVIDS